MPRPDILPPIDWPAVFSLATDYPTWLAAAENDMHREAMEINLKEQELEPRVVAWLGALIRPVHVLAIAEDWCPDVVRHVPVLQRMAECAPALKVRYIRRADCQEILPRFLTTGGESVPKFVFFNDQYVECGSWGPLPELGRDMIARGRAAGNLKKARENVFDLYNFDPAKRMVVEELVHQIDIASTRTP